MTEIDIKELKRECIDLLRVVTSEEGIINSIFFEYNDSFPKMIFENVILRIEDGELIWNRDNPSQMNLADWLEEEGIVVDIVFSPTVLYGENEDQSELYIAFREGPVNEDEKAFAPFITYIDSHYELMKFIIWFKKQWESSIREYAIYAHNIQNIEKEAFHFLTILKRDIKIFRSVPHDLPLCYHTGKQETKDNVVGNLIVENIFTRINIYDCKANFDIEDLKRTVRHEVIHYCLYLLNKPYHDDSAEFWTIATKYDAHPYKEMSKEEQEKYDELILLDNDALSVYLYSL